MSKAFIAETYAVANEMGRERLPKRKFARACLVCVLDCNLVSPAALGNSVHIPDNNGVLLGSP